MENTITYRLDLQIQAPSRLIPARGNKRQPWSPCLPLPPCRSLKLIRHSTGDPTPETEPSSFRNHLSATHPVPETKESTFTVKTEEVSGAVRLPQERQEKERKSPAPPTPPFLLPFVPPNKEGLKVSLRDP